MPLKSLAFVDKYIPGYAEVYDGYKQLIKICKILIFIKKNYLELYITNHIQT